MNTADKAGRLRIVVPVNSRLSLTQYCGRMTCAALGYAALGQIHLRIIRLQQYCNSLPLDVFLPRMLMGVTDGGPIAAGIVRYPGRPLQTISFVVLIFAAVFFTAYVGQSSLQSAVSPIV